MIDTQPRAVGRHRRARPTPTGVRRSLPFVLAALPWSWFLLRLLGPVTDPLALIMPVAGTVAGVAVAAFFFLTDRARFALAGVSLILVAAASVVAPRLPQGSPEPVEPFRLVSSNTYFGNTEPVDAIEALTAARADVLVAVESSRTFLDRLHASLSGYDVARAASLAVYSRWPVQMLGPAPAVPPQVAMRVRVNRPGSPFIVYALHLANPLHEVSFSQHAGTVRRLVAAARLETEPVVLAGDLNMSDRYSPYMLLDGHFRDAMRSGSFAAATYDHGIWALLQLRIDHVFVSSDVCAADPSTFPVPGSDHDAIEVELGRCP